ncbi:hypothetical protein MXB_5418, partial [Myxobolus squamalis]
LRLDLPKNWHPTHKTASSSLLNLFARIAEERNLQVALPARKQDYNFWPYNVNEGNMDKRNYPPDMHILHSVLYPRQNFILFPKENTFYVTILRNTITQWPSVFEYFHIGDIHGQSLSMEKYLELRMNSTTDSQHLNGLSRNPNFSDLGYSDKFSIPMILEYNYADNKLYEYFYKNLKIEAKQIKLMEFQELNKRKNYLENKCINGRVEKISYGSKKYLGYELKKGLTGNIKRTCEALVRSELEYVDFFRAKL